MRSRRLLVVAAAVILSGTLAARASADAVSSNWAGYAVADASTVATGTSGTPLAFSSVTATWRQPRARCSEGSNTYSAFWVGLGGLATDSQALEQIGTSSDCTGAGAASYSAWYELVPAASVPIALTIKPGDVVTASVNVTAAAAGGSARVLVQVKDRTRKTSFTRGIAMAQPDLASAEWIAEAPSVCAPGGLNCHVVPLANFGSVTFSRIAAIANGHPGTVTDTTWVPASIRLLPDARPSVAAQSPGAGATPSTVSADGRSFAVDWNAVAAG